MCIRDSGYSVGRFLQYIRCRELFLYCGLFLEEWENNMESFQQYCMAKDAYEEWKDKTLAYYASPVSYTHLDVYKRQNLLLYAFYLL